MLSSYYILKNTHQLKKNAGIFNSFTEVNNAKRNKFYQSTDWNLKPRIFKLYY